MIIKRFNQFINESNNYKFDYKILVDSKPYDLSQFNQHKYGVYIKNNEYLYYIGDIRTFDKIKYLSYLNIEKIKKIDNKSNLIIPDENQLNIIEEELNKSYLSPNLMDDTITYKEYIKKVINENEN